jgi:hypothetical protein
MAIIEDVRGQDDLSEHGFEPGGAVHHNPTVALLYTHALRRGDGLLAEGGPLSSSSGSRAPRAASGGGR